jgi:hypothetical protein
MCLSLGDLTWQAPYRVRCFDVFLLSIEPEPELREGRAGTLTVRVQSRVVP